MKYLKEFETTAQYEAYIASPSAALPNVSLVTETNGVKYNPDNVKSITDAVITCDSATYNGEKQIATNIIVTLSGKTLVENTDYTVSGNEGGINASNYTFTVNGIGKYKDSKEGTFTINKASRTMSWVSSPSSVTSGSSITVEAAPSLGVGDGIITYSSSDTTKATVNGNIVSGISLGSCTITATISEGTNYLSANTSYSLIVKEYRVVAKFNVTDTSNPTKLANSTSGFSAIEIDGVAQPSVVSAYTFNTTGEHTVKYTLKDTTSIGGSAFGMCFSLTSIAIPSGVTSIGGYAFYSCAGLTSIDIPDSVTSISDSTFEHCSSLTSIVSNAMIAPTISYGTFYSIKRNGTLTVPRGSSGYDTWMGTGDYYLGKYNWTKVEQ